VSSIGIKVLFEPIPRSRGQISFDFFNDNNKILERTKLRNLRCRFGYDEEYRQHKSQSS
jgi:hypothetical protein